MHLQTCCTVFTLPRNRLLSHSLIRNGWKTQNKTQLLFVGEAYCYIWNEAKSEQKISDVTHLQTNSCWTDTSLKMLGMQCMA